MRILFITERFPPAVGWVAKSAGRLSETLARMGHTVHVFVLSRELRAGTVESSELNNGPNVHRFGESKNLDFRLQQSLNFLSWLDGSVIRHKLF